MSECNIKYLKDENDEIISPIINYNSIVDGDGDTYSRVHGVILTSTSAETTFSSTSVELATYFTNIYYNISGDNYFDTSTLSTTGLKIKKAGYYLVIGSIYYFGSNDSGLLGGYITRDGTSMTPSRSINTIPSGNCYHTVKPQMFMWVGADSVIGMLAAVNGTKMTISFGYYTNLQVLYLGI